MYFTSFSVSCLAAAGASCAAALGTGIVIATAKPRPKIENCFIERNEPPLREYLRPSGRAILTRPNESPMNSFSSCARPLPGGYRLARIFRASLGKADSNRETQTHTQQVTEA